MRVRVKGAKHLPRSVRADNLAEATATLAEWFGIDRIITVRIRCYDVGLMGSVSVEGCRKPVGLDLFADQIEKWARRRRKSIREGYAVTLAHEMVHMSQEHRGSSGIPEAAEEAEALSLERVFAPYAIKILRGEGA